MAQKAYSTTHSGTFFAELEPIKQIFPVSIDSSEPIRFIKEIPGDYLQLKKENARLKAENAALKKRVAAMETNSAEELLEIREIPREQAKEEVRAFFKAHHGEEIYPSDVMEALSLDYDLVYEICEELEKEGSIKGL